MKITFAAIALAAFVAGAPAFAATPSNSDTTGMSSMSQPQDNSTQKQRHSKHAHKKRHATKHARHKKSTTTDTTGMSTQQ